MKIKFEPRDCWIGAFWDKCGRSTTLETDRQFYRVYICVVPCFPIILTFSRKIPKSKRYENW